MKKSSFHTETNPCSPAKKDNTKTAALYREGRQIYGVTAMKKSIIDELVSIFGEKNVLTDREDMIAYSYDAAPVEIEPDAVVFAERPVSP